MGKHSGDEVCVVETTENINGTLGMSIVL